MFNLACSVRPEWMPGVPPRHRFCVFNPKQCHLAEAEFFTRGTLGPSLNVV